MANTEKKIVEESDNMKKLEKQVLQIVNKYKNNFKQIQTLNDSLKKKIKSLSKMHANTAVQVELKSWSKSSIANDILNMQELSEQIDNICTEIKTLLEVCSKCQQQCINNLEKLDIKYREHKNTSNNVLKSKREVIENIMKDIENDTKLLYEEQNKYIFEIGNLKQMQKERENEFQLLVKANQLLEEGNMQYNNKSDAIDREIKDLSNILVKKQQAKESLANTIEENKRNFETTLQDINNQINELSNKSVNVNADVNMTNELLIEQQNRNENLLRENIKLEYGCKYNEDKSSELKTALNAEENEHLEKCAALNKDLELLHEDMLCKEEVLSNKRILEDTSGDNIRVMQNNLEEQLINIKHLEVDFNNLNADKSNLLQSISENSEVVNSLTLDISNYNERISNINVSISEINAQKSCSEYEHKSTVKSLKEETEHSTDVFNEKYKDLESKKLEYKRNLDAEVLMKQGEYNKEYKGLQTEIEQIQTLVNTVCEEKKQIEIDLAGKTLECDILARKVISIERARDSLINELKPKPVFSKPVMQKKRQADESSESSYDGGVSLKEHLLRKKIARKAKMMSLMRN